MQMINRCAWPKHELEIAYHDAEWGVPVFDDRVLFEFLTLEGGQAGLSWLTVLKKREGYRRAFHDFEISRVAKMTDDELAEVLLTGEIVRNRAKVASTRLNAQKLIDLVAEQGSFANYWWGWTDGQPVNNEFKSMKDLPAKSSLSETISKDLLKRGFKFVGPTIIYAMAQATGLVNDHTTDCFRHQECLQLRTQK
ncbi:Tag 3-methyladenine DNA glycosylase [Fimbriimonadaceae bacterium]